MATIAVIVLEYVLINTVLVDRDCVAHTLGVRGKLHDRSGLVALNACSNGAAFKCFGLVVGIPLMIWFFIWYLNHHNLVVQTSTQRNIT